MNYLFQFGAFLNGHSISSYFAPCSSRFTPEGESAKKPDWLTKIQLDRFCLLLSRFIEVHRVLSSHLSTPPSISFFAISRAPSSRKTIRGLPKKRGEERAENKSRWCNFHEPCRTICRFDSSPEQILWNFDRVFYITPPSSSINYNASCFHFFFFT